MIGQARIIISIYQAREPDSAPWRRPTFEYTSKQGVKFEMRHISKTQEMTFKDLKAMLDRAQQYGNQWTKPQIPMCASFTYQVEGQLVAAGDVEVAGIFDE